MKYIVIILLFIPFLLSSQPVPRSGRYIYEVEEGTMQWYKYNGGGLFDANNDTKLLGVTSVRQDKPFNWNAEDQILNFSTNNTALGTSSFISLFGSDLNIGSSSNTYAGNFGTDHSSANNGYRFSWNNNTGDESFVFVKDNQLILQSDNTIFNNSIIIPNTADQIQFKTQLTTTTDVTNYVWKSLDADGNGNWVLDNSLTAESDPVWIADRPSYLLTSSTASWDQDASDDLQLGTTAATALAGNTDLSADDLSNNTTTDLAEGANLYYTNTRSRQAISATGDISYDNITGVISYTEPLIPVTSVNTQTGDVVLDTDDVSEASNLYYTEARVSANTDVAANTSKVSADGLVTTHSDVTNAGSGQIITNAERTTLNSAIQSGDNISELNNDANYITNPDDADASITNETITNFSVVGNDLRITEAGSDNDVQLINIAPVQDLQPAAGANITITENPVGSGTWVFDDGATNTFDFVTWNVDDFDRTSALTLPAAFGDLTVDEDLIQMVLVDRRENTTTSSPIIPRCNDDTYDRNGNLTSGITQNCWTKTSNRIITMNLNAAFLIPGAGNRLLVITYYPDI